MSYLYMIRHGQASFGADDYDRLSPAGVEQAEILARHWLHTGRTFDAVYAGEMKRQIDTAATVLACYREAGRTLPELRIMPEFNEYDSRGILRDLIRKMAATDPELSEDISRFYTDKKAFQRVFERAVLRWVTGGDAVPGVISWEDFRGRVTRGIDRIREENGRGKTVAVFTSGGPISAAFQLATGISDTGTLRIVWHIVNASISTFLYDAERFSLASFNVQTHLEAAKKPALITYR
ncbi:MAG TPA: histidine phosphatase family protein [Syntrophales bacterium]|jgi:broad specificity phosphatase PhoE|nr:histidine phosphatase family protein [Syntrophales bacterium]HON23396.1 histidine phosphatase family protein [Syntrophales bacterium]HOU78735.1 histidine phosphatase family protein [Syntrophales bacterium]HPC33627.1 histidine phosphatase family protein [Syntrophales bacterium]HQG35277.1 histidine phosphatase family protein [Syntrophales bacterium]